MRGRYHVHVIALRMFVAWQRATNVLALHLFRFAPDMHELLVQWMASSRSLGYVSRTPLVKGSYGKNELLYSWTA